MSFSKARSFYNKYIKSASTNKLFLCRADLLFRNSIVPNIDKKKLSNNNDNAISLKLYFTYFLLAIYSLFNILRLKFTNITQAQYLIDIKNSDDFYDFRSKEILDIVHPQNSINFMHINNLKYSLKTLHKKSNVIYFEAIYYVLKPFLRNQQFKHKKIDDKFANELLKIHQSNYSDSYYIYLIVKKILSFLNIKTFISLDDSRYSNELNIASKDLGIKTIGYMHGRFNEFHLGLFEFPFNRYLVWSDYFKNKLLQLSDKYNENNIAVVGHFKIKEKLSLVKRDKNILWLGESNIDYKEIVPFIKYIIDSGYNLLFRGKPGANNNLNLFLREQNISIDRSNTYFECLSLNKIGLVVGTHSTALMESYIVGIPSLALKCSYDYGSHLWEDNLIELCEDNKNISVYIEKYFYMNSEDINKMKNKIWGKDIILNEKKFNNILKKG